jgi:hypothetical protein
MLEYLYVLRLLAIGAAFVICAAFVTFWLFGEKR